MYTPNIRSDILSLSSNNALLEFVLHSAPGVQEHLLDSKKDVDRRLKLVCEQFITDTSQAMLGPVTAFNTKVTTFNTLRGEKKAKLSSQPWADTNILTSAVSETVRLIKQNVSILILTYNETFYKCVIQVPNVQRKMQLYLANSETEFILFRPVQYRYILSRVFMSSDTILGPVEHPDGVCEPGLDPEGGVQPGPADHHRLPHPGAARRHPGQRDARPGQEHREIV